MKHTKKFLGFAVYVAVWLLLLLWFWIGLPPDGGMVFRLLSFYLALPILSFIVSLALAKRPARVKWLAPVFFGVMAILLEFLTFSLANTLAFQRLNTPDLKLALASAVPPLLGLCVGMALQKRRVQTT